MLSDIDIVRLCNLKDMVQPFSFDLVQPCSYDVRLGHGFMFYDVIPGEIGNYIDASEKKLHGVKTYMIYGKSILLEPGDLCLGTTIETVNLPDDIGAKFEGKSSLGRIGLSTHVTAGFIDSGFHGQITLEMQNCNKVPINVSVGMKIGQLSFYRLSSPSAHPYGSPGLGSHYQDQTGVTGARGDK